MHDAELRARLGAGARAAAARYALPAVLAQWNHLLAAASAPRRGARAAVGTQAQINPATQTPFTPRTKATPTTPRAAATGRASCS
jgi:hypothetical protein